MKHERTLVFPNSVALYTARRTTAHHRSQPHLAAQRLGRPPQGARPSLCHCMWVQRSIALENSVLSQPSQTLPHLTYPGSTVEPKALVRKPWTSNQLEIRVLKWPTSIPLNNEASALVFLTPFTPSPPPRRRRLAQAARVVL